MFCWLSKSAHCQKTWSAIITAIHIQKRSVSMSHHHDQGGCKSIGTVTCFFLGWVVAGFNINISFKLTILSELIILIDLRLLNSKPPRKAKKVKKPALKRPARASRKGPAAASPQIPVPRPQIPSIKCRNHFFCIVGDGSTSAGPGWVSGHHRKLWRTWWH